jgi:Tol biopolymer transport system component
MQVSPDGNQLAYWLPEKHELHVFSFSNRKDATLDSVPDAIMRQIVWSSDSQTLAYLFSGNNVRGLHIIDLSSGTRHLVNGIFGTLAPGPDPKYFIAVNAEGVYRINIADGQRNLISAFEGAADGAYSPHGTWLGVLVSQPSNSTATDDEPDCTGGTFALVLQKVGTKQVVKAPFPPSFDSVLDFAFSPDESAIAVTFGAAACDYPGDVARVYVLSLPDLKLTPISVADRLSVKAHWSPDSKVVIYSDYSGSDSPLMAVEVQSGRSTKLTNPDQWGPDEFLAWSAETH